MSVKSRSSSFILMFCVLVLVPVVTFGSFLGEDLFVPSVGRGSGASGSFWYTTVWFHNPGSDEAIVTVGLLHRGQANPTPEEQILTIPAGSTLSYRDAIDDLFGLEDAVGALRVRTTAKVAVGARVYNQPGNTIAESQGQLMAGIPASFAAGPGEAVEIPGVVQPADGSFRSNFGLVETTGATARVTVTLLDADGSELNAGTVVLGPFAAYQRSLAAFAPDVVVDGGILRFDVSGEHGGVLAFASAVASGVESQDPTTLDMTLDPVILATNPSPGITSVEAGPGLAGGGSEGAVALQVVAGDGIEVSANGVAVKQGGITAGHIAAGEVLLGAKVGNEVLTDVVTFAAGSNVALETDGNTITVSSISCFGERTQKPVIHALGTSTGGSWFGGVDELILPTAGRWRIGYRAVVEVYNNGYGPVSDPVNIALYDVTNEIIVHDSIVVLGQQIDLQSSTYATVSGEAVIEVEDTTTIVLAARSPRANLVVTLHPDGADVSVGAPGFSGASFLYSECIALD